jgi:hypothetical protein
MLQSRIAIFASNGAIFQAFGTKSSLQKVGVLQPGKGIIATPLENGAF